MGKTISKTTCCVVDQMSSNLTISAEAERLSLLLDDEPILMNSSMDESHGEPPVVSIGLKFSSNYLQLSTDVQEWPVCLSIHCEEQPIEERFGIDIVCLIETSSYTSDKADLIKTSMEFLMSRLSGQDRLSIVAFNSCARRLCPLTTMSYIGKVKVGMLLRNLVYEGSCDLIEGLVFALSVLNNRRNINSTTNVLLFTTGKDNHPDSARERIAEVLRDFSYKIHGNFSINIFALARAISILSFIAEETNGSCYFSSDAKSLLKSLAYSCGVMESKIAEDLYASIILLDTPIPIIISKIYSETGEPSFRLPDVLSGSSVDTIFLLRFLPCSGNEFSSLDIAKVTLQYRIRGCVKTEEALLRIPVFSLEKVCTEIELDEETLVSFYRVKVADILSEAAGMMLADFEAAKELLKRAVKEVEECCVCRHRLILGISGEVRALLQTISRNEENKEVIRNRARNHWMKRCFDVADYQNTVIGVNKNRLRSLYNVS